MNSFWHTFWLPRSGGNTYALCILVIWQASLAWKFYRQNQIGLALFLAGCVGANLARIGH